MPTTDKYINLFLAPIRKCKDYQPKFGESQNTYGVSLDGFLELYGSDLFYSWIGLDSNLMYAAHKAAGGKCEDKNAEVMSKYVHKYFDNIYSHLLTMSVLLKPQAKVNYEEILKMDFWNTM